VTKKDEEDEMNAGKTKAKVMTDGTMEVEFELVSNCKPDGTVVNTDHADQPLGDGCLALHQIMAEALQGATLKDKRYTDAYERKPKPDKKVANQQKGPAIGTR
jgi:hypothetical protein